MHVYESELENKLNSLHVIHKLSNCELYFVIFLLSYFNSNTFFFFVFYKKVFVEILYQIYLRKPLYIVINNGVHT